MIMNVSIERAQSADAEAVLRLVQQNGLPVDGLPEHLPTTVVGKHDGEVVATAALETYADGVLLRSVAVAPALHGQGLGRQLTAAAIQLAEDLHAPAIYLLTTTAEHYFPKFGFERIERTDVPPGVRSSIQFTSVCCSSAAVMRKPLTRDQRP